MTREEIKEIESSLLQFVQRATKDGARQAEIAVLPGVISGIVELEELAHRMSINGYSL